MSLKFYLKIGLKDEYECDVLDIKHTSDIGGKNENIANAESGIAIKTFEKLFPKLEKHLYQ